MFLPYTVNGEQLLFWSNKLAVRDEGVDYFYPLLVGSCLLMLLNVTINFKDDSQSNVFLISFSLQLTSMLPFHSTAPRAAAHHQWRHRFIRPTQVRHLRLRQYHRPLAVPHCRPVAERSVRKGNASLRSVRK